MSRRKFKALITYQVHHDHQENLYRNLLVALADHLGLVVQEYLVGRLILVIQGHLNKHIQCRNTT